jgi:hypothetical protein
LIGRLSLVEKVQLLSASRAWVPRLGVHSLEGNECLHGLFNRGTGVVVNNQTLPYVDCISPLRVGVARSRCLCCISNSE